MIKADLHIHSHFSRDGQSSPKEIVKSAIEKGIDCICITDHSEVQGAIEAMKHAFDKNLLVVPGIEVTSRSGDILGINVKKIIPKGLTLEQTIEEIKKQGGIAVAAHPFGWPLPGGLRIGQKKISDYKISGLEAFNAALIFNFSNRRALNFSQENNLPPTAGSDSHHADFVGRGHLKFKKSILSEKDLVAEILAKNIEIGGKPLSFLEILKNSAKGNVGSAFSRVIFYYLNQLKKG